MEDFQNQRILEKSCLAHEVGRLEEVKSPKKQISNTLQNCEIFHWI